VRVFTTEDSTIYFGCMRATGRSVRLWEQDGLYSNGSLLRLAGRFVAFTYGSFPECKADCPSGVSGASFTRLVDISSKAYVGLSSASLGSVLLTRQGQAAWLTGSGQEVELHVAGAGLVPGTHDRGTLTGLRLSGTTLTYLKDGAPRSLALL